MKTSKISKTMYYTSNSNGKNLKNPYDSNNLIYAEQMNKINNILPKKNIRQKAINQQHKNINREKIIYKPVIISLKYLDKNYDEVIHSFFQNPNQNNQNNLKPISPLTKTNSNFFKHRKLLINTSEIAPLQTWNNNSSINNLTTNFNYSNKIYIKPKKIKSFSSRNNKISSESKKFSCHSLSKEIQRLKELKIKYGNIYKTKAYLRNSSTLSKPTLTFKYFTNLEPLQINKNINLTIHSNSTSRKKYKKKQKIPWINLSKDFDKYNTNYNNLSNNKNSLRRKKYYEDITDEMINENNINSYRANVKKNIYEIFCIKNIVTPDKRIFISVKYISLYSKDNINLYNHFHKRRIGPEKNYTSFITKKFRVSSKTRICLPAMIQKIDIKNVLTKLEQYKKANQLKKKLSIIKEEKYNKVDIKNGILNLENFIKKVYFNMLINKLKSKNKKNKIKYKMRDKKLNLAKNNINNERYFLFSILDIDSFENIISYDKYIKKKNRMIQNLIFLLRIRLIKYYMNK